MTTEIRVLGPVELVGATGPVALPPKQRRLLAALAIDTPAARSSDRLIDVVWPETPPASAPGVLQVYVSQLRKALGDGATVRRRGSGYALEVHAEEVLDGARFERLLAEARAAAVNGNPALAASLLRRALALWRGRAYDDLADDEFAQAEAQRLEELRRTCAEELFEAELALGRHADILPELQRAAATEPLRERLQAQTMLALYRCGRQSEALDLFTAVRTRLRDELGLEPGPALRRLQRGILRHEPTLDTPPAVSATHDRLPAPPNALLGREQELRDLRRLLLVEHVRLLVLTGAGGSGKTRLAVEVAHAAAASFANGAVFVDLAPLRDPALVLPTIAQKLGIREVARDDPLETLTTALRHVEMLLVLDNAEHLHAAAATYPAVLAQAARVTMLVTSRTVLHLSGEHVYPVEPLDEAAAVTLFHQRARERAPRLELSGADEAAIPRICERLDGLPLAIELAAARVNALTPAELLSRLEPRLPLLAGGPHDMPARQRTLDATLTWSYDLLDEDGQRDLRRLAVFAGGCTLDAAEQVCATTIDRLGTLVDRNLLRRTAAREGASRYTMLETIREHALQHLEGTEHDAARNDHARYFVELAEHGYGARLEHSAEWLPRLEAEQGNLRLALDRLADIDPRQALRLAGALGWFWAYRGHLVEGRRRLTEALAGDRSAGRLRARALAMGAQLLNAQGDLATAREWGEQAAALAASREDPEIAALSLVILATVCTHQNELTRARQLGEQALAQAVILGRPSVVTRALAGLCYVLVCGRRPDLADVKARELLTRAREDGDRVAEMQALHYLGDCALQRGDCTIAEARYRGAFDIAWGLGHTNQAETELVGLAMALAGQSRAREALHLAAAVRTRRASENVLPSVPFWEELQDRYFGQARAELGTAAADEARRDGETMSIGMTVTLIVGAGPVEEVTGP